MQSLRQYTDEALMQLMAEGNEFAFTELYGRYHQKLYSFAFQLSGSKEEAKDIVQDVFSKIWERKNLFEGKCVFSSYLFKMIRNFSIDRIRRITQKSRIIEELTSDADGQQNNSTEQWVLKNELQNRIRGMVDQLPPRQKEVFILHREKGLKYNEIASSLGLSTSTVENHFSRAVEKLRQQFEPDFNLSLLLPLLLLWIF